MPTTTRTARKSPPGGNPRARNRIVLIAVAAAVALGAFALVVVSNLGPPAPAAVPAPAVTFRPLAGAGSDTTQDVVNALSVTILDITSYAPRPAGRITTRAVADNPGCTIDRPGSDVRGIEALIVAQGLAEQSGARPCIDFARATVDSSKLPGLVDAGLTYIPFARDAITFAQRADSANPRSLSRVELKAVFTCAAANQGSYRPVLPAYGSGLRTAFLSALGVTDTPSFVQVNTCVAEIDGVADRSENIGATLNDPGQITPYSVAQYLAQTGNVNGDLHGTSVLGRIDGVAATVPSSGSTVGIAHRADSPLGRVAPGQLKALYTCTAPGPLQNSVQPVLPPPGSAVRTAFLTAIGLTDAADFVPAHPCVTQVGAENDGTLLTSPREIVPYSAPHYVSQVNGSVPDVHGSTILGPVTDGAGPTAINPAFPVVHDVYNVVPTKRLAEAPTSTVFVGRASSVCAATATIIAHGFVPSPTCGDTTVHTPS